MTERFEDSEAETSTEARHWYQHKLVWMMIAIPFSAVIMGVVLITLAIKSYDGLVVDDYYKHGLEINRVLNREIRALELGLGLDLVVDPRSGVIDARFDRGLLETYPPTLELSLQHATRQDADMKVVLHLGQDDNYIGHLTESLTPGVWYFEASTTEWKLSSRSHIFERENLIELRSGHAAD